MEKRLVKVFVGVFVLLFALQIVSATTTDIKIKSVPDYTVELTISDGSQSDFYALERYKEVADEYGDTYFTFNGDVDLINLYVYVKLNNEKVVSEKFFEEETGGLIEKRVAPKWFEFIETGEKSGTVENETTELEVLDEVADEEIIEETEEIVEKDSSGITGFAIGDVFSNKVVIYSVIGVILLLVIILITIRLIKKQGNSTKEIKVKKLSELTAEREEATRANNSKTIDDLEQKMEEIQKQIAALKNEDKIAAAKKKLMDDEKELMKLRKGE